MIITIDGYSGSGKSTQAEKISEALEIPLVSPAPAPVVACLTTLRTTCLDFQGERMVDIFDALCMYRLLISKYSGNVVIEECLFYPFFHFDQSFEHRTPLLDGIISWFLKSMIIGTDLKQYLGAGQYPIASFYLFTTRETSRIRRFKREYRGGEINIDHSEGDYQEDSRFRFWKELECKVPFLHVINGMQTEAEVTADIMAILESDKSKPKKKGT